MTVNIGTTETVYDEQILNKKIKNKFALVFLLFCFLFEKTKRNPYYNFVMPLIEHDETVVRFKISAMRRK